MSAYLHKFPSVRFIVNSHDLQNKISQLIEWNSQLEIFIKFCWIRPDGKILRMD